MKRPSCQVLVNGELEIPCSKPPIEQIIQTFIEPVIGKVVVIINKVIIRGYVKIGIEYVGKTCESSQPVHFAHFTSNFVCFIDHPCLKPDSKVKLAPEIEYSEFIPVGEKTISKLILVKVTIMEVLPENCQTHIPQPHEKCYPTSYHHNKKVGSLDDEDSSCHNHQKWHGWFHSPVTKCHPVVTRYFGNSGGSKYKP